MPLSTVPVMRQRYTCNVPLVSARPVSPVSVESVAVTFTPVPAATAADLTLDTVDRTSEALIWPCSSTPYSLPAASVWTCWSVLSVIETDSEPPDVSASRGLWYPSAMITAFVIASECELPVDPARTVPAESSVTRMLFSVPPLVRVNGVPAPWPSTIVPVDASEPAPLKVRVLVPGTVTCSLNVPAPTLIVSPDAALVTAALTVRQA